VQRHIDLLATLWNLWGALGLLVGLSLLLLAAGAAVPLVELGGRAAVAAGVAAALFASTGIVALVWGGAHVWAGRLVRRRSPLGRLISLALAVVNLLVLPFGTALGIYALWVLLTEEGRSPFVARAVPPAMPR
jgi:hypothetical protein